MKPPKGGEILPVLALPLAGPRRPVGVLRDGAEGARNEVAELKADLIGEGTQTRPKIPENPDRNTNR